jgi:AhpD family alkylhydroperoxidase
MTKNNDLRLNIKDPDATQGELKVELDKTKGMFGLIPNVFKITANSNISLAALNNLFEMVGKCTLGARIIEQIALALATSDKCQYCARAHSAIAVGKGLSSKEILSARKGIGTDPKAQAAINLSLEINQTRGHVSDSTLKKTRESGISDEQIVEIILITTQNIFTHIVNNIAKTPCEFPDISVID